MDQRGGREEHRADNKREHDGNPLGEEAECPLSYLPNAHVSYRPTPTAGEGRYFCRGPVTALCLREARTARHERSFRSTDIPPAWRRRAPLGAFLTPGPSSGASDGSLRRVLSGQPPFYLADEPVRQTVARADGETWHEACAVHMADADSPPPMPHRGLPVASTAKTNA